MAIKVLPEDQEFTNTEASVVDLSADGKKMVYVANDQLCLRDLNKLTAGFIQGITGDPTTPIFSPDGLWVGYYSMGDDQWKKITVSGGAPVTHCAAGPPSGATWSSDNTIKCALEKVERLQDPSSRKYSGRFWFEGKRKGRL